MEITNIGYNYRHPSGFCVDRPYGSGDCLLLVIKTEAFIFLNGERIIVSPNSVVILKKGTPQLYGATHSEYINDWIHFQINESDESFISDLGIIFDTVFPLHEVTEISNFIKNIYLERYSKNSHKKAVMQRYFDLILFKFSEKIYKREPEHKHPYYDLFCTLRNDIRLVPQNCWCLEEISKKMNLSPSHIQHLYKSFFNTSITSDVQSNRVEYAKYLLSTTNMKVMGISQACGYNNDVHFMRIFKKATNMTPSEFRNKFRACPNKVK